MKRVVSVSLGSSVRDIGINLELAGDTISVERIGVNGNIRKAAELLISLDGKVDALGLGGADLGMWVENRYYPLHSVKRLSGLIRETPFTDGTLLKNCFESRVAPFLENELGGYLNQIGRRVLLVNAVSRWGMARSFIASGYECTFGDYMFSLGLPLPVRSEKFILLSTRTLLPIISRLPLSWLYPLGTGQELNKPRFRKSYREASVIAGDCLYITQSIPDGMTGRIIVTNTTTSEDIERFRSCGIRYVLTTTPVFEGRSFGMNLLEAILIALSNQGRLLNETELDSWIENTGLKPQLRSLTE